MDETAVPPMRVLAMLAAPVLAVVTTANFFWTYAFNDNVSADDHRDFLVRVSVTIAVLGALFGAAIAYRARGRRIGAFLETYAVIVAFASGARAVYALALVLPQLDSAVGTDVSNARAIWTALILGAASAITFGMGRWLLTPGTTASRRPG